MHYYIYLYRYTYMPQMALCTWDSWENSQADHLLCLMILMGNP